MKELFNNKTQIKSRNPIIVLTITMVITLTGFAGMRWLSYTSYSNLNKSTEFNLKLSKLRGEILLLDECLTMSTRMAIVTGDRFWENRYLHFEPQLDSAIKEALSLAPMAISDKAVSITNKTNIKLVKIEKLAFGLIHQGRYEDARKLINSNEYESMKQDYAEGMKALAAGIENTISNIQIQEQKQSYFQNWIIIFLILCLTICWIFVFHSVRGWQAAIALLNSELEKRVLERTAELESANKELESFSYTVSHDLRAPLRHINGFIELLFINFKEQLPEKAQKYLNTINDSSKQMGVLIDDLLKFFRARKGELQFSIINMNKIVNEVMDFLKNENIGRKINWEISDLHNFEGDTSMMKQVWMNLIGNAVKFTGTRETAIIKIWSAEDNNEISYYIQDNGVGFDMKYSDKLFGVFQRLHSTAEFQGTGIGLANVRRIILKHNGRINGNAEIDKGATFYFSLPKMK